MFETTGLYYKVEEFMICEVKKGKWVVLNQNKHDIIDGDHFDCEEDAYWVMLEEGLISVDAIIYSSDELDVA